MNSMKNLRVFVGILTLLVLMACQPSMEQNEPSIVIEAPTQAGIRDTPSSTISTVETATPTATATAVPVLTQVSEPTISIKIPTNTPLSPTPKPEIFAGGGWLVFESQREDTDGNEMIDFQDGIHVYSLNVETNELVQLTFGDSHDLYPVWSPTHTQIVFSSNRAGSFDLYIMESDGSNIRQLTDAPDDEIMPDWSANAEQLAYISIKTKSDGDQEKTLHLINLSDHSERSLFEDEGNVQDLNWSPDGKYLAFTRVQKEEQENGNIRSVNRVYLLNVGSMTTISLPLPYSSEYAFDNPKWLPRQDYFLSLDRWPSEFSSQSTEVFQLIIEEDVVTLNLVFVLESTIGWHTWGNNGEWFFSVVTNGKYYPQIEDGRLLYDLVVVQVDFSTQSYSSSQDERVYNYDISQNGVFITDNTYYDGLPDWSP